MPGFLSAAPSAAGAAELLTQPIARMLWQLRSQTEQKHASACALVQEAFFAPSLSGTHTHKQHPR